MNEQQIEIIHTNLTPEQTQKEHNARLLAATAGHRRDMATAEYMESSIREFKAMHKHRKITIVYMLCEICMWVTVILYMILSS